MARTIALAVRCHAGGAYSVVGLDEGVVYGDDVDVVVLDTASCHQHCYALDQWIEKHLRIAEDDTANATEAVDTNL